MDKQKRLDEIYKQFGVNDSKGLIDDSIALCRDAVNEFPNDYNLLAELGYLLGKREDTMKEAISINERILRDCTDDHIRYGVMQQLAYAYKSIGEKEKAIEVAKKLPSTPVTQDMLLDTIYDGEERINHLMMNIIYFCDYLTSDITSLSHAKYGNNEDIDGLSKRIELYKKVISIFEAIYEDGDYGFYNTRMSGFYRNIALAYMCLNDFDNALDCIEKAADYTIAFDTLPEVFTHTSIIPQGREFSKIKNFSKNYDYNDSYSMLHHHLSDEKYNPIREHERFKAVVAKLEKYAAKEE
jgi:tetratricopeptide (TPR) repeat protein